MTDTRFDHIELIPARGLPSYALDWQNDVALVHHAMHMPDLILDPGTLPLDRVELRLKLIHSEGIHELRRDLGRNDFIGVIDAFIDTLVVTLGALVEMGTDFGVLLNDSVSKQLSGARKLAAEAGWPVPTEVEIKSLNARFTSEIQQQMAQLMWFDPGELPVDPVFLEKIAEANAEHTEEYLVGLTAAFEQESKDRSVFELGNIFINTLASLTLMGIDAQPFFDEIQRANLSKIDTQGRPIHSRGEELDGAPAGKFLKSDMYVAPDLYRVFAERYPYLEQPNYVEPAKKAHKNE